MDDHRQANQLEHIGVGNWLIICSVVTEDSQNRVRSYGPFPEGAEPIPTQDSDDLSPGWWDVDADPHPDESQVATPPRDQAPPPTGIYESQTTPWTPITPPISTPPPSHGPLHNDPGPHNDSAPPPRRGQIRALTTGLLTGLLIFGTAGYLTGRNTTPPPPSPPKPTTSLGVFEQNQVATNTKDFQGTALTPFAQGWLPYVATCNRSDTPGGPAKKPGEKARVRCTLDGMSAIFVQYNSTADRNKARATIETQAADARTLTPGANAPTAAKQTTGNYVEYAYRITERGITRTVSAICWDDAKTPAAGYLLAYWKEGVGQSWEPMRDLWSRYA
ncbi:hypothetical protein HH310_23310 [Actinoplanes sp. TBRC 11911]|uniref:hypothetical protein n=1 Tax=Actinoplanes sp. TBRC 11911 TaxID=2729386 RepID=UPI00145E3FCF|nr:hypothetical protein [Actinoplanes sp. TBRC 11911]NMO54100.1 hypothetical protein [Actinoplanes sp. TBRC 11911]